MSSEARIESVFQETGKHFGYEDVTVEIADFKDFKVQWKRSYNWIAFRISDYIKDAPETVIEDLANALYTKIAGKDCGYGDEMTRYVKNPEFARMNRPRYLKRSRKIVDREGEHKDLRGSYRRLVEQGLIEDLDDDILIIWMKDDSCCKISSALMKVAAISTELDSEDVSDDVLDVALYEAICNIRAGQRDFGKKGGIEYDWDNHPKMPVAVGWCEENGMTI